MFCALERGKGIVTLGKHLEVSFGGAYTLSVADILIVAVVAALLVVALRKLLAGGGECSGCASSSTCAAHATGVGECPAAHSMVADAERRLQHELHN